MPILSLQTVKGYQQVLSPEQGKTKVSEEKSQEENPPVTFCLIVRSLQLVSCAATVLRRKKTAFTAKNKPSVLPAACNAYGGGIRVYLIPMTVRGTLPSSSSDILYFALPMMTLVPILTGSIIYSSLARAPFAPLLEAPMQFC